MVFHKRTVLEQTLVALLYVGFHIAQEKTESSITISTISPLHGQDGEAKGVKMNDWTFKKIESRQHDRFTPMQACKLTHISVSTIRDWVKKGYLKTITKPGGNSRILFRVCA